MSSITEIEAFAALEKTLSGLEDPAARDRVLKWAWDKYSSKPTSIENSSPKTSKASKIIKKTKSASKTKTNFSIVKDLNLKPEEGKSFQDFVNTKLPKTGYEKSLVAVYYLKEILGIKNISVNHVFTCYKDANWRVPADLYNNLAKTASSHGWIDTSNMDDIRVTTQGENYINFDLPSEKKSK